MATLGTYYFDTASFTNATTVYDDANLTTISQNGWYSDSSIVRQQISGVLLAAQSCSVPTPVPTPTAPIPVPVPVPVPAPVAPSPVPSPVAPVAPSPSPSPVPSPVAPSPSPVPVPVPAPVAPVPAPVVIPTPVPAPVAPVPAPVAPTPVPAPVVQCYAIYLQKGSSVCSGSFGTYYFDASSLSSATTAYANSSCNSNASPGYYTQGLTYRYWNGSSFTQTGSC